MNATDDNCSEIETLDDNYKGAKILTLLDVLSRNLLVELGGSRPIKEPSNSQGKLSDGVRRYHLINGSPLLMPQSIEQIVLGERSDDLPKSSTVQYYQISLLKQQGETNADPRTAAVPRHQYRWRSFCKDLNGLVVDIGGGDPLLSASLLPPECEYLSVEPYPIDSIFSIIAMGEVLPVRSASVDVVTFNTSLDHILDYHTAIDEAARVIKSDGVICLASYVWLDRATLLSDAVHFHHFREFEIVGSLERHFRISEIKRYKDPKGSDHRIGFYVRARKLPS